MAKRKRKANGRARNGKGDALRLRGVTPGSAEWMRAIKPRQPCLKHGVALPIAAELQAQYEVRLERAAPHLLHQRYAFAKNLLARALIRLDRIDAWYATAPKAWFIKSTGSGRATMQSVEQRYASLMTEAWRGLHACGLTPAAAKELGLSVESPDIVDLETIRQRYTEKDGA